MAFGIDLKSEVIPTLNASADASGLTGNPGGLRPSARFRRSSRFQRPAIEALAPGPRRFDLPLPFGPLAVDLCIATTFRVYPDEPRQDQHLVKSKISVNQITELSSEDHAPAPGSALETEVAHRQ